MIEQNTVAQYVHILITVGLGYASWVPYVSDFCDPGHFCGRGGLLSRNVVVPSSNAVIHGSHHDELGLLYLLLSSRDTASNILVLLSIQIFNF